MGTVSVIIPNYNRAAIIGETIENMLSQTLSPHEVIVVDDGSTDDSLAAITSFGSRVTLIRQVNKGPGAARNAALQTATGDFVQFMDSDDLASLNKLEVQVNALENQGADIVLGPWIKVWKDNNRIRPENVVLQQEPLPASRSPLTWFLTRWSMVFQQSLVRRELLIKAGSYREDMRSYEDGDLFVKLLLAGGKLIHEHDSLTFYRLDDYGKLTASGQHQQSRVKDEALFYTNLIGLSDRYPALKQSISHPDFARKVWNVSRQLKESGQPIAGQFGHLDTFAGNHSFAYWLQRIQAALQQRLRGHRWPGCYKTGPVNAYQKKLISDLGWVLT